MISERSCDTEHCRVVLKTQLCHPRSELQFKIYLIRKQTFFK